jgi:hypothetical protein
MSNPISAIFFMPLATPSFSIERPQLPLAIYLEVAAHLQQVAALQVQLRPQTAPEFDYLQSQVGGLSIDCRAVTTADRSRVAEILDYYERRYGAWTIIPQ